MEQNKTNTNFKTIFAIYMVIAMCAFKLNAQDSIILQPAVKTSLFKSRGDGGNKLKKYSSQVEKSMNELSDIQSLLKYSSFSKDTADLNSLTRKLKLIDASFKLDIPVQPRDLQLYLKMVREASEEHDRLKASSRKIERSFGEAEKRLAKIAEDPLLNELAGDPASKKLVQLEPLLNKWQQTDSTLAGGMAEIDLQGIKLSSAAITIKNLTKISQERLFESGLQAFRAHTQAKAVVNKDPKAGLMQAFLIIQILASYFQEHSFLLFIFPILCIAGLYWWIMRKKKFVELKADGALKLSEHFSALHAFPLTCVVFLVINLMPALDFNTPSIYQSCIQLATLFLVVRLLGKRSGYGSFKWYYLFYFSLLIFLSFISSSPEGSLNITLLILVNAAAAAGVLFISSKTSIREYNSARPKLIALIFAITAVLSSAAALTGHTIIAHNLSSAGIAGLLQFVCLLMVKKIVVEIIKLQFIQRRLKLKLSIGVDTSRIEKNLSFPINFFIAVFCVLSFANNMTFYALFSTLIDAVMSVPLHLGSVHITSGSIIYFLIIVMIAHFLKRHIGYMFGDTGIEDENDQKVEQSTLVITRLLIICLGYLTAVSVSGLPVDKITIVLGALSVGVGLGFQNIVNNFVSGIILLFERPLKIGDSVQVNGRLGRVKEMGVRTSTLQTEDGAEIIIPNGTILSQDIINWSHTNNRRRFDLQYTLLSDKSPQELEPLLTDALLESQSVLPAPRPIVLFEYLGAEEIKTKMLFWSKDDRLPEQVLSEIKIILFNELYKKDIKFK